MIAFAGNSSGGSAPTDWDIWTTDIEGVTQTNITAGSGGVWPSWSPDGSMILFARTLAAGGASLMTIVPDPDASPIALTDGTTLDQDPSWSPDGSSVLFDRTWAGGTDVYTMFGDGSHLTLVARNATTPAWQAEPTVSPHPPIPTPTATGPIDLGLAFPVCDPRTMPADMDGNGTLDTVTIATKMSDAASCPARGTTTEILVVDLNGDGKADAIGGPLACPTGCEPFAAPDVDADGTPEIAMLVDRQADGTERIQLWRVTPASAGGSAAIVPFVDVKGDPATFRWGSHGLETFGVSCETRTAGPIVIAWTSTRIGPAGAYISQHGYVSETGYRVADALLLKDFSDNYYYPGERAASPDEGGFTMCGAPIHAG